MIRLGSSSLDGSNAVSYTHLGKKEIEETVSRIGEYGIERIVPLHCTGLKAISMMQEAFGSACLAGEAGLTWREEP